MPESGRYGAIGYAQESGIPFSEGLVKNAYVGRTFIQPSQTIRQLGIRLKLNPLKALTITLTVAQIAAAGMMAWAVWRFTHGGGSIIMGFIAYQIFTSARANLAAIRVPR